MTVQVTHTTAKEKEEETISQKMNAFRNGGREQSKEVPMSDRKAIKE